MTDPRARLLLLLLYGAIGLCLDGAIPLLILAALPTLLLLAHPNAAGWRLRIVGLAALLCWSTVLSQGLFWAGWPRTPIFALGPLALYREGLIHGLVQSARFVAALSAGALVVTATPADRLLAALISLRLPPGLVMMGTAALRALPMIAAEWVAIRQARAQRGRPWRPPHTWIAQEAALLRPLMARCLRRARALAESLDARGFDPLAPRTVLLPVALPAFERAVIAAAAAAFLALAALRLLFLLYQAGVWYDGRLLEVYAWVRLYL